MTTSSSANTTSTSSSSAEPERLQFSAGWEMPDLRSPVFSQRPKCAGVANHQNGLFFPEQHRYHKDPHGNPMTPQMMAEESKDFCHGRMYQGDRECPVRLECLEWSMENWQRHGIWGGLSEPERCKLKDRRVHEEELAELLVEIKRDERLATSTRGWETRRKRAAERERGYWLPEGEAAAVGEEVRRGA